MVICALTFRRPEGVARLLRELAKVRPPAGVPVSVLIVDNDPDGSAASTVEAARDALPFDLRYVVEPERGISSARNRAVAEADDDWIVFIDDDEWPEPQWLEELWRVATERGADVVTGPVLPEFEEGTADWVREGRFFDRPRFADGAEVVGATTSSVLIRTSVLGTAPFDPRFNTSGGGDTHLFMRLRLQGARLYWADRAVVWELIPASRADASWLIRRQYRRGITLSRCLVLLEDSMARRVKRVVRAVGEVAAGAAMCATAVVRGRITWIRGRQRVAFGWGLVTGMFGAVYEEYRTVHGR